MCRDQGDDHQGPQAHARHRGRAGHRRAARRGSRRLNDVRDLFDRAAATYDRAGFPFFSPFGELLVDQSGIRPDDRVLDAGCGAGAALKPAAAVARKVVGIDISPGMVERAREAVPEAQVLVGDAAALPFDDASFDVVLSAFTVFFFDEPTDALREWARVLEPAGRIAMTTWGAADPRWGWERELRMRFIGDIPPERLGAIGAGFQRLTRFDEAGKVEDELGAAGFAPESVDAHEIEFRFADEHAWWEWNWSHGTRGLLEALPEGKLEEFREQAFTAMQPLRDAKGGFPKTYTALVALASSA